MAFPHCGAKYAEQHPPTPDVHWLDMYPKADSGAEQDSEDEQDFEDEQDASNSVHLDPSICASLGDIPDEFVSSCICVFICHIIRRFMHA